MWSYFSLKIKRRKDSKAGTEQIGFVKGTYICNISPCQHAYTYTYIPGSEIAGSSRTSLIIRCKVYKQGVVCRKHNAEPYTKQQSNGKKEDAASECIPLDDVYAS